jgi:hypothetical protein
MTLADITLGVFMLCNSLRVVAYVPPDHQGGQGSERCGSHLVFDVGPVPVFKRLCDRLRARQ